MISISSHMDELLSRPYDISTVVILYAWLKKTALPVYATVRINIANIWKYKLAAKQLYLGNGAVKMSCFWSRAYNQWTMNETTKIWKKGRYIVNTPSAEFLSEKNQILLEATKIKYFLHSQIQLKSHTDTSATCSSLCDSLPITMLNVLTRQCIFILH